MNKMKTIPMLFACILIISVFASITLAEEPKTNEAVEFEQIEKPEPHGSISITGSAVIECFPDLLTIMLKIKGFDPESAQKARDEAAKIIDLVLKALKNLGISEDDISTTSYNIQPRYEWVYENNYGRQIFLGYEVIVSMKVSLKDFDKGGKVIDAAVDSGALVDSISFELTREKREELKLQAMADAAKDAKLKAETIIDALGEKLGNVTSVSLNDYSYQPYKYWDYSMFSNSGLSASQIVPPTTILPGDLSVSANVYVTFDIL
jgi:uncharacterized protein